MKRLLLVAVFVLPQFALAGSYISADPSPVLAPFFPQEKSSEYFLKGLCEQIDLKAALTGLFHRFIPAFKKDFQDKIHVQVAEIHPRFKIGFFSQKQMLPGEPKAWILQKARASMDITLTDGTKLEVSFMSRMEDFNEAAGYFNLGASTEAQFDAAGNLQPETARCSVRSQLGDVSVVNPISGLLLYKQNSLWILPGPGVSF
jgi:hypothetical protein